MVVASFRVCDFIAVQHPRGGPVCGSHPILLREPCEHIRYSPRVSAVGRGGRPVDLDLALSHELGAIQEELTGGGLGRFPGW